MNMAAASAPMTALNGAELREGLAAAARWLEHHAEAINALNVFPVPDGDTGLNMSLTLRSSADHALAVTTDSLSDVADAMARGALMGARGNSGVILAQILRGIARALEQGPTADAKQLAHALAAGSEAGYKALENPVEGTILTVAKAAAQGAQRAAKTNGTLMAVLESAHRQARAAVAETPELLPVLKQAGVVDAGGEGYRIFLEGLLRHLRGEPMPEAPATVSAWADLSSLHQDEEDFYGYCTEVLFQGSNLDPEGVRQRVNALGTCVLVVGDSELIKVHVHTLTPGAVLDLATGVGEIVRVKVDNMQLQHQEFARAAAAASEPLARQSGTGLVAVVAGTGLERLLASLGGTVVRGGQTMNPSVEDILAAIREVTREEVIILPNNANVVLAAEQAAALASDRTVAVVPTRNVAQGIAAALALNPEADASVNGHALQEAADRCHCIEITRAVRNASLEGLTIRKGALMAILDDRPVATARSYRAVLGGALARLPAQAWELATVYVGATGGRDGAHAIADVLGKKMGVAVEVIEGGQPHYDYIVAIE